VFEEKRFENRVDKNKCGHYCFVNYDLCSNVLFFKLRDAYLNEDILFCASYIEPEGSVYFNRNAYDEIENAIAQIGIERVCILGDLNSRTGQLLDTMDSNVFVDGSDDDDECCILPRVSQDHVVNNMGRELISFCKTILL
jgi:hypothetical protein